MGIDERVDAVFEELRGRLRSKAKRKLLRDLNGQLREDEALLALLTGSKPTPVPMMVTFDRRRHDHRFSYGRFDLLLEALDAIAGGSGLSRPVSQVRVIHWHGTRKSLRTLLRRLASNNRELRYRRLLVMRFQIPAVGHRINQV
jgi:hypothetical protein